VKVSGEEGEGEAVWEGATSQLVPRSQPSRELSRRTVVVVAAVEPRLEDVEGASVWVGGPPRRGLVKLGRVVEQGCEVARVGADDEREELREVPAQLVVVEGGERRRRGEGGRRGERGAVGRCGERWPALHGVGEVALCSWLCLAVL